MTNGNRIVVSLGVLILCSVLGASQALGQNVTIGGKVQTLETTQVPVAGATVSVYPEGTPSTTTDEDGSWSLSVPAEADPVLKIGATVPAGGACGPGAPRTAETYTKFPLALLVDYQSEPYQYDISAVLKSSMAIVKEGKCAIIGFALQYTSLGYPAAQEFLSGVDVDPDPYAYMEEDGATPCDSCTETTTSGAWVDLQAGGYSTAFTGTKEGSTFSGGDVTCVANTANVTGLVDIDNLPSLP